jgi:tRNA(Ile)-lysidine synthase
MLRSLEHFQANVVLVRVGDGAPAHPRVSAPFGFELAVPGAIRTGAGWIIEAELSDQPRPVSTSSDTAHIDAGTVTDRLLVRNRRPGDRLRPVGLGGSKKLQDVFVDRKVARAERDAVPIITDDAGRIS